jgi:hypothetical protein
MFFLQCKIELFNKNIVNFSCLSSFHSYLICHELKFPFYHINIEFAH